MLNHGIGRQNMDMSPAVSCGMHNLTLATVQNFYLFNDELLTGTEWSELDFDFVMFGLKHGLVSREAIDVAIAVRIKWIGRNVCYAELSDRKVENKRAERTTSPNALAYAIRYGELKPREIASIRFCYVGDVYGFIQRTEPELLLARVRQQLFAGPYQTKVELPVMELA